MVIVKIFKKIYCAQNPIEESHGPPLTNDEEDIPNLKKK
jgi:hypothetical protein